MKGKHGMYKGKKMYGDKYGGKKMSAKKMSKR
jgi:hypothetical protein